ncbi:DNA topoisomerase IV [Ulvibacter antarcticus]|uniref:DNA topoisomerase IV n=1 Tax=Ulvibacter antarcticus TaxID=442714 RepID=A0A3L9YUY4_9FLAO|nr:DNA topoisomerase IV [Ulvibacter antarcticus]RMA64476.1 hypothetical protein BXY75_1352 [Ulvibacter antarcticus]
MRFPLILLLILSLSSCYNAERSCDDFRTGSFEFETMVGTEIQTTTFVRKDSIEIDYFRGKADTSYVRWINDCEWISVKKNPVNMAEEQAIHFKILSTTGDSYDFQYKKVIKKENEKMTVFRGTARKTTDNFE